MGGRESRGWILSFALDTKAGRVAEFHRESMESVAGGVAPRIATHLLTATVAGGRESRGCVLLLPRQRPSDRSRRAKAEKGGRSRRTDNGRRWRNRKRRGGEPDVVHACGREWE
jgi:hypothetical protein